MERFTIKFSDEMGNVTCALCGEGTLTRRGPRLVMDEDALICRDCGARHAPTLLALLDLATVADRVGQQSRHMLTPPMKALLDLAQAAEKYSAAAPRLRARVG